MRNNFIHNLGTYARFMDRCKVVDLNKMSPEEV